MKKHDEERFLETSNPNYSVSIYQNESQNGIFITTQDFGYINDPIKIENSIKIEKETENNYFQFSSSEVNQINIEINAGTLEYQIEESTCALPLIFASRSFVSFKRSNLDSRGLEITDLSNSNLISILNGMNQLSAKSLYKITLKPDDGNLLKYVYLVCPFFKNQPEKTVLKLTTKDITENLDVKKAETVNGSAKEFDFNEDYSGTEFLEVAFSDPTIQSISLDNLMTEEGTMTKVDFTVNQGYLFATQKTINRFSLTTEVEINYVVYSSIGTASLQKIDKKSGAKIELKIDRTDIENPETEQTVFVLIFKAQSDSVNVAVKLIPEESKIVTALKENWKYFFFFLLFLLIPIVWKIILKIRENIEKKKREKDAKKHIDRQESIEKQKKARRITLFLHQNKDLDRKSSLNFTYI